MGEYRRIYPKKIEITRLIAAARDAGIDVGGFEVSPDGSIRIMEARMIPQAKDAFAEWDAAGKL